jgi:hypothetical protein
MASINDVTPEEWDALTDKERYYDNRPYPKEVKSVTEPDPVESPAHYNVGEVQAIDYIQQQLGSGVKSYLEGSVLKYMHRWRFKNGVEDLRKARWFLDRLIYEEVQGE